MKYDVDQIISGFYCSFEVKFCITKLIYRNPDDGYGVWCYTMDEDMRCYCSQCCRFVKMSKLQIYQNIIYKYITIKFHLI